MVRCLPSSTATAVDCAGRDPSCGRRGHADYRVVEGVDYIVWQAKLSEMREMLAAALGETCMLAAEVERLRERQEAYPATARQETSSSSSSGTDYCSRPR